MNLQRSLQSDCIDTVAPNPLRYLYLRKINPFIVNSQYIVTKYIQIGSIKVCLGVIWVIQIRGDRMILSLCMVAILFEYDTMGLTK